ncbi:MAG: MFS transporter, partial [Acetobacteraceae bacterium]|nr:MFS transporter [Acetobacteraceae bacterium]
MPPTQARRSWPRRLATASVFAASGIGFGAWAANIPRLREAAGLDDASLGVLLFCVSLGAVLAMRLVGRLAGRVGTARACGISAACLVVALPLPALAPDWPLLLASGLLLGLAHGGLDVSMNAHAAEVERAWGSAIMSSFHAGWSLGQLAGAAAAGLLARAGAGLSVTLALSAGAVACFGLAALVLEDGPPAPLERERAAWPRRAMLGICAIAALSFAIEGGTADWCGVYLRTVLGAPAALASTALAAFAAAMVVCRLCGDRVVRRLGPVRVVQAGAALTGVGLLGAILSPGPAAASASFALVGLGVANTVPVLFSAAGRKGAAGVATMATAGYGAIMAAPPLIGFVANAAG